MPALKQIRIAIGIVIMGLVISGVTAFPLLHELRLVVLLLTGEARPDPALHDGMLHWILRVREGLEVTHVQYPFLAYGTDWLAFGHLVIALFFILPWREPVRYAGVLHIGVIASLGVIPLALICGPIRGIPFGWQLIDSSFGLLCLPPLVFALRKIRGLDPQEAVPAV
ncbi:hypothetical protein OKA04_22295 [Luteolibacter flavescens]|uniref:Uncharacterized protein n=1 Tax=Luteolibacter flavescens TaxID=1859460 RepID=A0ABT3FV83_9BACT|nr:hypothetical protein [Luteolibacter flavescens]MCW1887483.1 hypothetical protein [Luteolibacter flavescens]